MKKTIAICLALLLMLCFCTGCGREEGDIVIPSSVDFRLTVPGNLKTGDKIWFQCPFYEIRKGSKILNNDEYRKYTIGEDVQLSGTNTELLNGGTISVIQHKCTDFISGNALSRAGLFKRIRAWLFSLNASVLSFNLVYYDNIPEPVIVNSMYIPELDYSFEFDRFCIDTMDIPEGITYLNGNNILGLTGGGGGWSWLGPKYSDLSWHFSMIPYESIKSVEFSSANDICTVQEPSQYSSAMPVGENVDIPFEFKINTDDEQLQEADSMIFSFIVKVTAEDGSEYWMFEYLPGYTEAEYAVLKYLD